MSKPLVLISYNHKDKEWVKDYLLANLEKNNIPCHIDYRAGALVKQKTPRSVWHVPSGRADTQP